MQPREIIILFVVLLVAALLWSNTYSWHDEIHQIQSQYGALGLPEPDRAEFTCDQTSTYFGENEMNSNDGANYWVWNQEHMDNMDCFREWYDDKVTASSIYRTPDWNDNEGGTPKSRHMYGTAGDGWKYGVGDTLWQSLSSDSERDRIETGVNLYFDFVKKKSDHLHLRTGSVPPC